MKKLSRKQLRKIAATVGVASTIAGAGTLAWINRPGAVDAAPEATVKYVDDANFKKGSDINFDIYDQVPTDQDLNKLVLYDKLEPVYTHTKTRIFDGDTDITDQGKLDFDKKTNTTNWTANDPEKWFGKKLTERVSVHLQDNADLSKYLDKNTNVYSIPNVGDMITNDKTTPSNVVHVHTPKDINPNIVKSVQDKDGKWGQTAKYNPGDSFHYKVKYKVPHNGTKLTNLEFYDDLEDVLDLKDVKVSDEKGNDITKKDGVLKLDNTKESFNWTPKDSYRNSMMDHSFTVDITATLKKDANLTKYLDKASGLYQVPNTAYMKYNNKPEPSNTVHVVTPPPTNDKVVKYVKGNSDSYHNDKDDVDIGKDYTYKVEFTPATGKTPVDVEFDDDLEDVLDLEKVVVQDPYGKDVTSTEGTLKTDQKNESFTWTPKADVMKNMGGMKYTVYITAKVKDNSDLSKYVKGNEVLIPNTAHMKNEHKDTPSNTVNVTPPVPTKNKITKQVKGLSGKYNSDTDNVEVGKDYTYKIDFTPAVGQNLKDMEITDDLEDVLDLEKVVVENPDGKDITDSDGTLKLDKHEESFNWQPKDSVVNTMGGKTYSVLVTARVKPNTDLQKYIKNNQIQIPNTAHFKANGKDTPSNTPTVTPKTQEPSAKKGIIKNPSDWAKFFGTSSSTAASQQDNGSEPAAWKDAEKYVKRVPESGNPDGYKYVKANSSVTDKQFNDAVKALSQEHSLSNGADTGTSTDAKTSGSNAATTTPTNSSDLKQLINASTVTENEAARGDAVDYLLTFNIGNQDDMKSLVLSDNLEDVLDLKNVVIIDSDGNNITNDGQLNISQSDESWTWTAKDPQKYSGKTIYAAVGTNIKQNADLTSYDNKEIPNVGHLIINGKDYPTNQVKTKLNGNPKAPGQQNGTNNPNGKNGANNPGANGSNPLSGKGGLLPQTGRFILQHLGAILSALIAAAAGLGYWLFKRNKKDKEKLNQSK